MKKNSTYNHFRKSIFAFIFSLLAFNLSAQVYDSTFFQDRSFERLEKVNYTKKLSDGLILSCSVRNSGPGIVKINQYGKIIWSSYNHFSDLNLGDYIPEFLLSNDGHLYAAAIPIGSTGFSYFWKVDTTNGNVIWINKIPTNNSSKVAIEDYDSTTLIAAYFNNNKIHMALINKANGDTLSTHIITTKNYFNGTIIQLAIDYNKNVYLTFDKTLIKFNGNNFRQIIWERSYLQGVALDGIHKIILDNSDQLYLFGRSDGKSGSYDGMVFKINTENGDTIWARKMFKGDIQVIDIVEKKDSFYVSYNHIYFGSVNAQFFMVKFDKKTGNIQWFKSNRITKEGTSSVSRNNDEGGVAIDVDCAGNLYATGYYVETSGNKGQWGTLKLDANTGEKLYDFTISDFPLSLDEISGGIGTYIFNDSLYLLGYVQTGAGIADLRYYNIDKENGKKINFSGIDYGIQHSSNTLKIESIGDTVYLLKQQGKDMIFECLTNRGKLIWSHIFDETYDLHAGKMSFEGPNVYISALRKNPGTTPPKPDKIYVYKLDRFTGNMKNSAFQTYDEFDITLLDLLVINDTCFVFYVNEFNVNFFRWDGKNVSANKPIETRNYKYTYPGGYNLVHHMGETLIFIGNLYVYKINKANLSVSKSYTFAANYENFDSKWYTDGLLVMSTVGTTSTITALDLQVQSKLWQKPYYEGQAIYQLRSNSSGQHYTLGVSKEYIQVMQLDSLFNINWTYSFPQNQNIKKQIPLDLLVPSKSNIIGISGLSENGLGHSDGLFRILNDKGDSLSNYLFIDGNKGQSQVRTAAVISDSTFWFGGAWNIFNNYRGFVFKLEYDTIKKTANISSIIQNSEIRIFPNPTNKLLYIEGTSGNSEYFIIDKKGSICAKGMNSASSPLDVTKLKMGNYILIINTGEELYSKQFIKQ